MTPLTISSSALRLLRWVTVRLSGRFTSIKGALSLAFSSASIMLIPTILCSIMAGQDAAPGVASTSVPMPGVGRDYIKDLSEIVDPGSGSVSLRLMVPIPHGRGLTMPFNFAYDSNGVFVPYSLSGKWSNFTVGPLMSTGGWSYTLPAAATTYEHYAVNYQHGQVQCPYYTNWRFVDPIGGRHGFGLFTQNGLQNVCGNLEVLSGSDIGYQGSVPSMGSTTVASLTVADSSGTTYSAFSSTGLAQHVEDRNGNVVSISDLGAGAFTVTDTAGREVLASSGFGSTGNTLSVSGMNSLYSLTWETTPYNFTTDWTLLSSGTYTCSPASTLSGTLSTIQSITLPNGKTYTFTYDPTYGLLSQITYPSGAWIQYTWGVNAQAATAYFPDSSGNPNGCLWRFGKPTLIGRSVSFDGVHVALSQTFQYSSTWPGSPGVTWSSKQTIVTTTDDIRGTTATTTYVYSPIFSPEPLPHYIGGAVPADTSVPVEQQVTYSDTNGQPIETVSKTWYNGAQLKSEQVSFNNNPPSAKSYSYGSGGVITEEDDYDFKASTPTRRRVTNYQSFNPTPLFPNAPSILDLPCQSITYDGNNTRFAETDYFYDNGGTATPCGRAGTPSVTSAGGNSLTNHDELLYSSTSTYPRGILTQETRWLNTGTSPVTTYAYDETGQVLSITDPNNSQTLYAYADMYLSTNSGGYSTTAGAPAAGTVTNTYLTEVTAPQTTGVAHIRKYAYGYNDGELTQAIDENGNATTYRYNDSLSRLTEVDYPDTGSTTEMYDDSNLTVTTTQQVYAGYDYIITTNTLDGFGNTLQSQLTSDPDGVTSTVTTYDGYGRRYVVYSPTRCTPPTIYCLDNTGSDTWGTTTYTYDALGRIKQVTEADGSVVTTSYSNNQTTMTDEVGNQLTSTVDGLGRLISVREAPNSAGYNFESDYQYDPLNNLTCVVQKGTYAGGVTTCGAAPSTWRPRAFTYDSLSRILDTSTPEAGTVNYTYDADGNLISRVAPKPGQSGSLTVTTNYTYDSLNRLTAKSYVNIGTPTALYAYDGVALANCNVVVPVIANPTNLIGQRTAMCYGSTSSSFSYDTVGRVSFEARSINAASTATYTIGYTYTQSGAVSSISYPSGNVLYYGDGAAGREVSVGDLVNTYTYYAHYTPAGDLYVADRSDIWPNSFETVFNIYNNRQQPIQLSASSTTIAGGAFWGICNDFHFPKPVSAGGCQFPASSTGNNGSVFQIYSLSQGYCPSCDPTRNISMSYDPVGRILQANTLATTGPNCWGEVYTIDAWGNLTNRSGVSGMPGCSTEMLNAGPASTRNQLNGVFYDAAGNVTDDGLGNSPTYDGENRVIADSGVTYLYDADGNRVAKSNGTMYWRGEDGSVLAETDLNGNIQEEYIYFNGERIARVDRPSGTVHYYFSDPIGSASVITDIAGNTEEQYYYYPYGGLISSVGSDPNHYEFTGKERDSESYWDNFEFRFYSSALGRFVKADEPGADLSLGNPQSFNLYTYVRNNPFRYTDPSGHTCQTNASDGTVYDDGDGKGCAQVDIENATNITPYRVVSTPIDTLADIPADELAARVADLTSPQSLSEVGVKGETYAGVALGVGELASMLSGLRAASQLAAANAIADSIPAGIPSLPAASRAALDAAANGGGETVTVVTNLTTPPAAGRTLSVSVGDGAEALSNAMRPDGKAYTAQIPKALIKLLEKSGLARESIHPIGSGVSEIQFKPQASQFVVPFFK